MPLAQGTRLGSYEILSIIGAGGMGEVYRARDARLDRDVAIKVLAPDLARDLAALSRFEREALSVAKLSHPNILAIHEFGRQGEMAFVVTELVDGETLRARLAGGPLSPRRAAACAQQIARGIAAAHARGIVHRDLKPENVMIGRDDHVTILDFGLAKPIAPVLTDETRVARVQTTAGTVLGTFGYMAPEQVRGLEIDHRADIFALGAVLYEMLSGERAFKGETAADTMSAILSKDPPDLDLDRLSIPSGLDRIVRRCLEKAPELRFQSATDLAFALDAASSASSSGARAAITAGAPRARGAWLPWSLAAVAAAAAIATWLFRPGPEAPALWQRFTPVTEAAGEENSPAISPDGGTVAYVMRANGRWGVYGQRVGGRNATPIVTDPERDLGGPAYSPDGASIAFHEIDSDGGIFVAGATGESARRLTDFGFDPAWSPDGGAIAFTTEETRDPSSRQTDSALYVVEAAGGAPRRLVDGDAMQAAWSPSRRRIVYWSNTNGQRDLFTVAAGGGARVQLTDDPAIDWAPVWAPDGRSVYFSSDRGGAMNIWRIAVDEATGKAAGAPEPVTNGVQASAAWPRLSKDGSRLAFRSRVKAVNPVAIPFDPLTLRAGAPRVLDGSNNIRVPSDVSPDGSEIAYFGIGERLEDLYIGPPNGSRIRHLTDDAPRDRAPKFTRDGKSVVFYSTRDGNWGVWMMRVDGSGLRKITTFPSGCVYAMPSPVDDTIVFTAGSSSTVGGLIVRPAGTGFTAPEVLPNQHTPDGIFNPTSFSPDGTRLGGVIRAGSGQTAMAAVYDLATHTVKTFGEGPVFDARFLPDSRRIVVFARDGSGLIVFDTVTGASTPVPVALPGPPIDDVWAIARDGRTIYYGAVRSEADIWIAEKK